MDPLLLASLSAIVTAFVRFLVLRLRGSKLERITQFLFNSSFFEKSYRRSLVTALDTLSLQGTKTQSFLSLELSDCRGPG